MYKERKGDKMKYTNNYKLPEYACDILKQDTYDKQEGKYSATELINGGLMNALIRKHQDDIIKDVTDNIWTVFGNAVHSYIENLPSKYVKELRVETPIEFEYYNPDKGVSETMEVTITSKGDLYIPGEKRLVDVKNTSKYATMYNKVKPEWEAQLNINRYIYKKNLLPIEHLEILCFYKDLGKIDSMKHDFCDIPLEVIKIPTWTMEETEEYIIDRVKVQLEERQCNEFERWRKPEQYKVKKRGAKRATANFNNYSDAEEKRFKMKKPGEYEIEYHKGEDKRCLEYCDVKRFCNYYKENYG